MPARFRSPSICECPQNIKTIPLTIRLQPTRSNTRKKRIQGHKKLCGCRQEWTGTQAPRGLAQLLHDVTAQKQPYHAILVYDVSRWGRFQDTDEAAYYEFLCKRAGVPVYYCAEMFANDGSMPSAIFKSLKRMMAGEYGRDLFRRKCTKDQSEWLNVAFRTGGTAGYGFRRMLVSTTGEMKARTAFRRTEKHPKRNRVILVLGPAREVQCVRDIFRMLIEEQKMSTAIASSVKPSRCSL